MDLLRIIDELEQLVENAPGLMGKKLVNELDFFQRIQRLRTAIPQAVKDSEDTNRRADQIIKAAQAEADRLIAEAKSRSGNPFDTSTG